MKKILSLALALTLAVGLCACGGETAETAQTAIPAPVPPAEAEATPIFAPTPTPSSEPSAATGNGRFSQFAGTYRADQEQMYSPEDMATYSTTYPDITLLEDGSLEGGYWSFGSFTSYPEGGPQLIEEDNLGVLYSQLEEGWVERDETGEIMAGGGGIGYYIYPVGVSSSYLNQDDTSKVRLTFIDSNGGVFYANYIKND